MMQRQIQPGANLIESRGNNMMNAVGRLKAGKNIEHARPDDGRHAAAAQGRAPGQLRGPARHDPRLPVGGGDPPQLPERSGRDEHRHDGRRVPSPAHRLRERGEPLPDAGAGTAPRDGDPDQHGRGTRHHPPAALHREPRVQPARGRGRRRPRLPRDGRALARPATGGRSVRLRRAGEWHRAPVHARGVGRGRHPLRARPRVSGGSDRSRHRGERRVEPGWRPLARERRARRRADGALAHPAHQLGSVLEGAAGRDRDRPGHGRAEEPRDGVDGPGAPGARRGAVATVLRPPRRRADGAAERPCGGLHRLRPARLQQQRSRRGHPRLRVRGG